MSITIYSKVTCPYCDYAKALLDKLEVAYDEVFVDQDMDALALMMERSGRRTVPQIFIHGQAIGGFDDLSALHEQDKLMDLINKEDRS